MISLPIIKLLHPKTSLFTVNVAVVGGVGSRPRHSSSIPNETSTFAIISATIASMSMLAMMVASNVGVTWIPNALSAAPIWSTNWDI
jgi:hypothetical protein